MMKKYQNATTKLSISNRTACCWLKKLGFELKEPKSGLYIDGHERPDVVESRADYLKTMKTLRVRMVHTDQTEDYKQIYSLLPKDQRPIIVVYQDESIFHANDDNTIQWCDSTMKILKHKSPGRGLMVSGWLNEITGWLPGANIIMKYGKQEEGYWTSEKMTENTLQVINKFEETFPWAQALFVFDNSSNHKKMAANALNAAKMNLGPGGKQPVMHATNYNGTHQEMVFTTGENKGLPKGLKLVLQERGLWDKNMTKSAAQEALSKCEDFAHEPTILQHTVKQRGHLCIYLPKFHCELNPIEMVWSDTKKYTRNNCKYSFNDLQQTVPEALNNAVQNMQHIANLFNITQQLEAIYPRLQGDEQPDAIRRKYLSHRRNTAAQVLDDEEAKRWALKEYDICPCFVHSPHTHLHAPFGPESVVAPAQEIQEPNVHVQTEQKQQGSEVQQQQTHSEEPQQNVPAQQAEQAAACRRSSRVRRQRSFVGMASSEENIDKEAD